MNRTMPADTTKAQPSDQPSSTYTLFFETTNETYALRVESVDGTITYVCIAARSKHLLPRKSEFDILGYADDDQGTQINITYNDPNNPMYSVLGSDRNGNPLHITIVPDVAGAIVAVNNVKTSLLKYTPLLGTRTKNILPVRSETIVGTRVLISGISAESKYTVLNGCKCTIIDNPKLGKVIKIPVRLDKKPPDGITQSVLINKKYLVELY